MSIEFLDPNANVTSKSGQQNSVLLHIVNKTGKQFEVFWIDRSGEELSYAYLENDPFRISARLNTDNLSAWVVKALDGTPLYKFVSSNNGVVTLTNEGPIYEPLDEKHLNTDIYGAQYLFTPPQDEVFDGKWSSHWGHGVPDAARALGVDTAFTPLAEHKENNHGILNALGFTEAWAAGYTGKGVKVAVLDGGLIDHPEITTSGSWNTFSDSEEVQASDDRTHGLKVAAPIAAAYDADKYGPGKEIVKDITGGSPDVELIDIQVAAGNGAPVPNIVKGIHKAVELGAKVIQISFIGPRSEAAPEAIKAVHHAYDNNVLVVWAGGNYGLPTPSGLGLTSMENISVTVGNYNFATLEPYQTSNLSGPMKHPYFFAPSNGQYPDKDDSYALHVDGGTSFSSPYVSAMAALLFQKYPQATVSEIIEKLQASAWQPSIGRDREINADGLVVLNFEDLSNTSVNGTALTDLLTVNKVSSAFSISNDASQLILTHGQQQFNVSEVERLQFVDKSLAFDTEGKAGDALQLISALTGSVYLEDKGVIGQVIHMLDTASDRNDVAASAVDMVLGSGWSSNDLITLLLRNVYDSDPTPALMAVVSTLKSQEDMNDLDILWMAAESENNTYIDLVGLASSGIEYTQFA